MVRVSDFGSSEGAIVTEIMEVLRQAVADAELDWAATNTGMFVAVAAAHFAGQQLGTAIIAGVAKPQDKRRFVDAMMMNVREGIKIGERRAARVERDLSGSTVQ